MRKKQKESKFSKMKIKKKDQVMVIAGKDKGKKGEVLKVFPDTRRVLVSKINIVTKHQKRTGAETGGLQKMEAPIHVSNVMVIDPKTEQPTRVRRDKLASGERVRIAVKSGEVIL